MPILANNNYYPLKQFRNAGVTDFRGSGQRDAGKKQAVKTRERTSRHEETGEWTTQD